MVSAKSPSAASLRKQAVGALKWPMVCSNPCLYRFLLWLILGASSNAEESMDGDVEMMRNFFRELRQ